MNFSDARFTDPKAYFSAHPEEQVVLAVDLDEVSFDYIGTLEKKLTEAGKKPERILETFSFQDSGWFESREKYEEFHRSLVEEGLYAHLPALPGAQETLEDLHHSGYNISILTSRFVCKGQHAKVLTQTAEALDRAGILYDNIAFLKNKTLFLADAYKDDAPHNVEPLRAQGRFVICADQSYNQHLAEPRSQSWAQTREILRERFGR